VRNAAALAIRDKAAQCELQVRTHVAAQAAIAEQNDLVRA
jgi:hypothetical protein